MAGHSSEIYYDPYDFQIDDDPYPIWKRMRDEMPLYRNERFDFFAVSRFADVEACSRDWRTFISGKGTVLEIIRAGVTAPRGMFIFEDPPIHDPASRPDEPRVHAAARGCEGRRPRSRRRCCATRPSARRTSCRCRRARAART